MSDVALITFQVRTGQFDRKAIYPLNIASFIVDGGLGILVMHTEKIISYDTQFKLVFYTDIFIDDSHV